MGEDDEEEEDDFINNHDLIGVDGIIEEQKNEINKKLNFNRDPALIFTKI